MDILTIMRKFKKMGFDLCNFDEDDKKYLNENNFEDIINLYNSNPNRYKIMACCPKNTVFLLENDYIKYNYFDSTKIEILNDTNKKSALHSFKVPLCIKDKIDLLFESKYLFENLYINLNSNYMFNKIHVDNTIFFPNDLLDAFEQYHRKTKTQEQNIVVQDDDNNNIIYIDEKKVGLLKKYNISKYLQNNLYPRELSKNIINSLSNDEKEFIEKKNITVLGMDLSPKERKIIHSLLIFLSTTNICFKKVNPTIKFSKKLLFKTCGLKRYGSGKKIKFSSREKEEINKSVKELNSKYFIVAYKDKNSGQLIYKVSKLFNIIESEKNYYIIELLEPILKGLIKNDNPFFDDKEVDCYERIDSLKQGKVNNAAYTLYDLIFTEKNRVHNDVKQIKEGLKNFASKIGLKNYIDNRNYKVAGRFLAENLLIMDSLGLIKSIDIDFNNINEVLQAIKDNKIVRIVLNNQ